MSNNWRPDRIGGHGFISNGKTGALVYEDATIDWLCLPRFDSEACLASLLGNGANGGWWLHPSGDVKSRRRKYIDDTLVLETIFETEDGEASILDFMSIGQGQTQDLIRIVEGRRGTVEIVSRLALRFDNGRTHPEVQRHSGEEMTAIAGPNAVVIRFDAPIEHVERAFHSRFTVKQGERRALTMTWFASYDEVPKRVDTASALDEAESYWGGWSAKSVYDGVAADAVKRSLLTLKGLFHVETGGMVAAATSSLPERPGGSRN